MKIPPNYLIFWKLLHLVLISSSSITIPNFADQFELSSQGQIDAFQPPVNFSSEDNDTAISNKLLIILEGFTKWDSQYFLFISKYGYHVEDHFAFFPLWPYLLWVPQLVFQRSCPLWEHILTVFWGLLLNILCSFVTIVYMEKFVQNCGKKHLKSFHIVALIILLNPASIFFNVLYTESLYLCLNVIALYLLMQQRFFYASVFFHLASWTRANGVVNAGYFLFLAFVQVYKLHRENFITQALSIWKQTLYTVIVTIPYFWMESYAYLALCANFFTFDVLPPNVATYLLEEKTKSGIKEGAWCHYQVPLVYGYIQKTYWNNGFLRYYTLRNIPNFLLAFPMVCFVPVVLLSSELRKFDYWNYVEMLRNMRNEQLVVLAAYVQLFILYIFSLLFMNIQVITRFLFAACPILFAFLAEMIVTDLKRAKIAIKGKAMIRDVFSPKFREVNKRTRCFIHWTVAYTVLGIILHPNRLPWT